MENISVKRRLKKREKEFSIELFTLVLKVGKE